MALKRSHLNICNVPLRFLPLCPAVQRSHCCLHIPPLPWNNPPEQTLQSGTGTFLPTLCWEDFLSQLRQGRAKPIHLCSPERPGAGICAIPQQQGLEPQPPTNVWAMRAALPHEDSPCSLAAMQGYKQSTTGSGFLAINTHADIQNHKERDTKEAGVGEMERSLLPELADTADN